MRAVMAKNLQIDMRKSTLIPDLLTLARKETNKRVLEKVVEGDDEQDEYENQEELREKNE